MSGLDEIYQQYAQTVYRFLLARTGSPELAEELTQETFFQAVRSIGRFDGSSQISTWLCGIAKNVLRTYRKGRYHQDIPLDSAPEPSVPSAEEMFMEDALSEKIYNAIHNLDEPAREIVYLRLLGGLSFRQIADIMNHTENWARVNYYRARQILAKELDEYE